MNHNLQSHPKFQAKYIRDLTALYDNKKYDEFISKFKQYKQLNTPDDTLVLYYFESLMRKRLYYYVVNYALERMQEGIGDYEDNMSYMLKAMLEEKRYDEILDFTQHLMDETIPHRFRMFVQEIRQDALSQIKAARNARRKTEIINTPDDLIDKEKFMVFTSNQQLTFLHQITEQKVGYYRELVRDSIKDTADHIVKTLMLLYLKAIDDNEAIAVPKGNQVKTVIPKDLPALEHTILGGKVLNAVKKELESDSPDLIELTDALIIGVLMQVYPMDPPFDDKTLINGFLKYIFDIVNIPHDIDDDKRIRVWIENHL